MRITNLSGTSKHFSLGICDDEKEKEKGKEKDEVKETENEEKEDGTKIGR